MSIANTKIDWIENHVFVIRSRKKDAYYAHVLKIDSTLFYFESNAHGRPSKILKQKIAEILNDNSIEFPSNQYLKSLDKVPLSKYLQDELTSIYGYEEFNSCEFNSDFTQILMCRK